MLISGATASVISKKIIVKVGSKVTNVSRKHQLRIMNIFDDERTNG